MRIFQCISSGGFYGAEAVVVNLSNAMSQLGHSVVLGVFHNSQHRNLEIADRARELAIKVVLLPCEGRFDLSAVRRLATCVREAGAHIVHTHGYKADFYGLAANRSLHLPLVATCHNWTDASKSVRFYARIDRWCLHRFHRVFCVSELVREILIRSGATAGRIVFVPNGVDVSRFASASPTLTGVLPPGGPVVGMVGRLSQEKGLKFALAAAAAVLRRFPTTRCVLVGDGPERDSLQQHIRTLGITSSVTFTGRRNDMPGVYRSLDLLLLPSLTEGMPMTILEAMAAGVPVIASRVGGVPQILNHNVTGLLVEPRDVAGLQSAVESLLADQEFRSRIAATGYQWIDRHGSNIASAKSYLAQYKEVLGSSSTRLPLLDAVQSRQVRSRHR